MMNDLQYVGLPLHKKRIIDVLTKFKANPLDKNLPHPHRMKQNNFIPVTPPLFFGQGYEEGLRILENTKLLPESMMEQLYNHNLLKDYILPDNNEANVLLVEMVRHALFSMRNEVLNSKFFQIRDSLDIRLHATDLNKGCPSLYLRAPFVSAFIKFNQSDTSACQLRAVEGNVCQLEGAYIFEIAYSDEMKETLCKTYEHIDKYIDFTKLKRIIHITFSTYPSSENMPDMGSLFGRALFIEDENEDIDSVLRKTEAWTNEQLTGSCHSHAEFNSSVRHLVKVLLYLNSSDARLEYDHHVAALQAKLVRAKPKKQAKLARQLSKTYDKIIVGPKHYDDESIVAHNGEGNKPHWRRGHYRVLPPQHHRAESLLIWIKPTLVRADKIGIITVEPKSYAVI